MAVDDIVRRIKADAEEAARMAGLDYKIDTVLNLRRDPLEFYAGDFVETQRKAAAGAMRWHATESPEADVVVVGLPDRFAPCHKHLVVIVPPLPPALR